MRDINSGSGNGVSPDGTKPLPESMLTSQVMSLALAHQRVFYSHFLNEGIMVPYILILSVAMPAVLSCKESCHTDSPRCSQRLNFVDMTTNTFHFKRQIIAFYSYKVFYNSFVYIKMMKHRSPNKDQTHIINVWPLVDDRCLIIIKKPMGKFNIKTTSYHKGIPVIKMRRSWNRLIVIMGIHIMAGLHIHIESGPGYLVQIKVISTQIYHIAFQWFIEKMVAVINNMKPRIEFTSSIKR